MNDFSQLDWNSQVDADCRAIVQLAVAEDLGGLQDWTTLALVSEARRGAASIVAREAGIVAGMPSVSIVIELMNADLEADILVRDGDEVAAGATLLTLSGTVRDLLTVERTLLNLLSRLMGIATLAGRYVALTAGTKAMVYDTRKTTPGWRRLEKYAVRCGGACNHRMGLYDAILIKDNHLAQYENFATDPAAAVRYVREFLQKPNLGASLRNLVIEIEVDTLEQLGEVLPAQPEIVLLDNMSPATLRQAVKMRDELAPGVLLEASGGVNLETMREVASSGVDRISVGALTHSARSLDLGLDWDE